MLLTTRRMCVLVPPRNIVCRTVSRMLSRLSVMTMQLTVLLEVSYPLKAPLIGCLMVVSVPLHRNSLSDGVVRFRVNVCVILFEVFWLYSPNVLFLVGVSVLVVLGSMFRAVMSLTWISAFEILALLLRKNSLGLDCICVDLVTWFWVVLKMCRRWMVLLVLWHEVLVMRLMLSLERSVLVREKAVVSNRSRVLTVLRCRLEMMSLCVVVLVLPCVVSM